MFPAVVTAAVSCSSSSHGGVVPLMIGCCLSSSPCRQLFRSIAQPSIIGSTNFTGGGKGLYNFSISSGANHSTEKKTSHFISSSSSSSSSSSRSRWDDDDDDYEVVSGKRVFYWLEEEDIVTFLDPPKQLIPLDPSSYNPAAYLWKKIEAVPEERRHRLLHLLQPRLISRAWEIAGTKYEKDPPKLAANQTASTALLMSDGASPSSSSSILEFWNCRTSGGPIPLSWINFFKKAIFASRDGIICGRILAGPIVGRVANFFAPLYFTVNQVKEVMSTEHPCDFAYNFGDGLLDIHEYPSGFPKPAKHPWPFNDQVVIYVRHLGPGVLVGQAWQEGEDLKKLPQKLCGEILMVKEYATSGDDQ